ncbi:DUF4333 domain-containing protein [Amycolatopsis endophytica]|uniref:DUF4333 domain-containing protein n=1 Tax=Amycolatopsis endophytica TaxID=860233 RepID=A0A853AYN7_9PSEU|nr:DUF4333 domain-containing protein [Amycolatopsis endophytica]NYI87765.1 hypothetical protein [Amycolatopsis endophytica]
MNQPGWWDPHTRQWVPQADPNAPRGGPGQQPWSAPGQQPAGAPTPPQAPQGWGQPGQWNVPQGGQQGTPSGPFPQAPGTPSGPVPQAAPSSGPIPRQGPPTGPQPGQWQPSYGGFGAFGEQKPKRSKKPFLIGGAVIVVLAAAGVGAWLLGVFQGDTLDQAAVQDGVTKVLREDFGEGDVKNAQCPEGQPVETGTTFECSVTVAGQPKKVTVRVLNDQAQYEVGMPR